LAARRSIRRARTPWDWHYFPDAEPAFPADITARVSAFCGTDGVLGNRHASGTQIIEELGAQHMQTGQPICYTSADSVFQIAAHEERFGLQKLLDLCRHMAPMLHAMKVGRVIARPFVGGEKTGFTRTKNRRDFAIETPAPTLLDWAKADGRDTYAIGKIGDIFSGRGIDETRKGEDAELMTHLHDLVLNAAEGSFTFANFVQFDTADHGNDPTWRGTDHTREQVPVIGIGAGARDIGVVDFVDVAASVADHLGLSECGPGRSFL